MVVFIFTTYYIYFSHQSVFICNGWNSLFFCIAYFVYGMCSHTLCSLKARPWFCLSRDLTLVTRTVDQCLEDWASGSGRLWHYFWIGHLQAVWPWGIHLASPLADSPAAKYNMYNDINLMALLWGLIYRMCNPWHRDLYRLVMQCLVGT